MILEPKKSDESILEGVASMQEQVVNPPLPPTTHRRPRVREVSSRFMSPVAPSSSSPLPNNKQRSSSVQKQPTEPLSCADENRIAATDLIRSPPQRKHQQRAVMKLFKENGGGRHDQPLSRSHRPDTPTVTTSSKLRLIQQRSTLTMSSAAKLLQISCTSSSHLDHSNMSESSPSPSSLCHVQEHSKYVGIESNHLTRSCSTRSLPDLRSSVPEISMLPTVSARLSADKNTDRPNGNNDDSCKSSSSPCSRSLDFPRSALCEYSLIHSVKASEKTAKQHTASSIKMGGLPLPPVPPYARKGRKVPNQQEEVHSLRLMHNHYLQWRYVNAKAGASIQAQRRETERILFSLGVRISELYELVKFRRIELGLLQRTKALSAVLDAQMPFLEEWSAIEGDYTASLLEVIQALLNVSLRLPISGNIRADPREVGEALNSAMKLMELIALHVQSFIPKAAEMEILISELARVAGGERVLIEECGDLLFMTYRSQAEECSLRSQLIQLNQICHGELQRGWRS